ncbi:hypothetical protein RZS08_59345, partial [Arthrospira platensis SPKY1]|nr:hypothetical protein [Arthrospira platensis SPKY1]
SSDLREPAWRKTRWQGASAPAGLRSNKPTKPERNSFDFDARTPQPQRRLKCSDLSDHCRLRRQ